QFACVLLHPCIDSGIPPDRAVEPQQVRRLHRFLIIIQMTGSAGRSRRRLKIAWNGFVPDNTRMARKFKDLSEREILALAIALEEEDARIYGDFAEGLRDTYPASSRLFEEMQAEESAHRAALLDSYQRRFGDH